MSRGPSFVLVVDDDEAVRSVMAEVLREDGYDVVCASNGAEALDIMHTGPVPEVVLLDLMMPGTNGWQVLESMGKSPRLASVPVVVLTSFDAREDLPVGRPALHKPMDGALLLELLHTLVDQNRQLAFALEEAPSDLMPRSSQPPPHPAKH